MALTARAEISYKTAYLNTDFGLNLAMRRLELSQDDIEKIVGRYVRGKRKGQLRGKISWLKVDQGGWVKTGPYDFEAMRGTGFVARLKVTYGYSIVDAWTGEHIHGFDTMNENSSMALKAELNKVSKRMRN